MVTFTIIEKLNSNANKYEKGIYKGYSLWLADDALLIADSEKDLLKAFRY